MDFKSYRKSMGWSLAFASQLLGLTPSTVAKHERGMWMPNVDALARYEKLTGGKVTASDFLSVRRKYKARSAKVEMNDQMPAQIAA